MQCLRFTVDTDCQSELVAMELCCDLSIIFSQEGSTVIPIATDSFSIGLCISLFFFWSQSGLFSAEPTLESSKSINSAPVSVMNIFSTPVDVSM